MFTGGEACFSSVPAVSGSHQVPGLSLGHVTMVQLGSRFLSAHPRAFSPVPSASLSVECFVTWTVTKNTRPGTGNSPWESNICFRAHWSSLGSSRLPGPTYPCTLLAWLKPPCGTPIPWGSGAQGGSNLCSPLSTPNPPRRQLSWVRSEWLFPRTGSRITSSQGSRSNKPGRK